MEAKEVTRTDYPTIERLVRPVFDTSIRTFPSAMSLRISKESRITWMRFHLFLSFLILKYIEEIYFDLYEFNTLKNIYLFQSSSRWNWYMIDTWHSQRVEEIFLPSFFLSLFLSSWWKQENGRGWGIEKIPSFSSLFSQAKNCILTRDGI